MFTAQQQSNGGKAKKGVRKDAISHGLYAMVRTRYGTMEKYFLHLDKVMPGKPADMIAKYIPQEIAATMNVTHNVLVCNFPEPRQLASDVKELDVIAVDGCKADSTETPTQIMDKLKELDSNDLSKPEVDV